MSQLYLLIFCDIINYESIFNDKTPETQIELGEALFNFTNLLAVVVFFSQIVKIDGDINTWMIFGGIFSLVIFYLLGLEFVSSGEELKNKAKLKNIKNN